MSKFTERMLVGYSLLASAALILTLSTGAGWRGAHAFDELTVHRINVVEPDGTLRMVISNSDRLPGVIVKGKEEPKSDRPQAGMLFYNNEGSEDGGLVFGGHKDARGQIIDPQRRERCDGRSAAATSGPQGPQRDARLASTSRDSGDQRSVDPEVSRAGVRARRNSRGRARPGMQSAHGAIRNP
jgi:hypothetical protein